MTPPQILFTDGAAYERFMGVWSQAIGATFLEWLAPAPDLRWLDVGCGNGAFTEMVLRRCAPTAIEGIDLSPAQLEYARARLSMPAASFQEGNAMDLPVADDAFDVAVMPLVIFFVPDPAVGVREMTRAVRPGGTVAAYAWDLTGGGFPYEAVQAEMRALGIAVPMPPSPDAGSIEALCDLWTAAGLEQVETREIVVHRTFADFGDFWTTVASGAGGSRPLADLPPDEVSSFKARVRDRLPAADASGGITTSGRANAIRGRVPAA